MSLPRFAVLRPVTTAMAIAAALVLGSLATSRLPLQFLPELAWPSVTVAASHAGSSPEEIERLIVRPLEDRLSTLPRLKGMASTATASGASIRLEFDWDADMGTTAMEVRERIDLAQADLPADLEPVRVLRFSTADFSVLHVAVAWAGPQDELEDVIDNEVVPVLQRLPGVAAVEVSGLLGRRVLVELDRDRVEAAGLDTAQVAEVLRTAGRNVAVGTVLHGGRRWFVRATLEAASVQELRDLPLGDGRLRLADVATVTMGHPERERVQRLDGRNAVTVEVYKATDANMVDVARRARQAAEGLPSRPGLERLRVRVVRDRSVEVVRSLTTLRDAGIWGGGLAALVLLLFLRQVRPTLLVLIAIPSSLLVTLALMLLLRGAGLSDITLNLVSLTALMLAVGMLIDNSVVVMENIHRERLAGLSARAAALKGAGDVARAVTAATLTTVVVFASMLGTPTDTFGRWLSEFGLAITCALVASLVVALTLVPMAASRLFRRPMPHRLDAMPRLGRLYEGVIRLALRRRWAVVLGAGLLAFGSWHLLLRVDRQPGPRTAESRVDVDIQVGHGYTMEQYLELFERLEQAIEPHRERLGIEFVASQFGVGQRRAWDSRASLRLYLAEAGAGEARLDTAAVREEVRSLMPDLAGVTYRFERLRHFGGSQDIGVELAGPDAALLELVAEDVGERLRLVPGLADVQTNLDSGDEELRVVVDRTLAAERGVTAAAVARALGAALGSRAVSRLRTTEREIDILVQVAGQQRASLEDVRAIDVAGSGGLVPLSVLARFEREPGPRALRRENRQRTITVTGEPAPGAFFMAGTGVQAAMEAEPLPAGVTWKMGRAFRDFQQSQAGSLAALGLAIVLIYLVMASLFESLLQPLTIMASLPFGLTGVGIVFWATSTPLDAMAYLGFLVLAGLVVNNGILLVDTTTRLRAASDLSAREAIVRAGRLRLRPILITTLTTLVGLLPLVAPVLLPGVFAAAEGRFRQWATVPLAVFGGLLTSTILTLGVTPVVYTLVDDLGLWLTRTWRSSAPASRRAA